MEKSDSNIGLFFFASIHALTERKKARAARTEGSAKDERRIKRTTNSNFRIQKSKIKSFFGN